MEQEGVTYAILDHERCKLCQWYAHASGAEWWCSMPIHFKCSNREVTG